ncbi:CCN family member 5 [Salminus brasiliensis]|uniref:CCN family member 5 n=1 Tax=Salminus brasiliensis TaxID=930266 RepID=UPI003B830B41
MDSQVRNGCTHALLLAAVLLHYLCCQICCQQCGGLCQCPSSNPVCPDNVPLVVDGCGCCQICARQKGESCSDMLVCDKKNDLQCDYSASFPGDPGECVSAEELSCELNGVSYQDGEVFQPSCAIQCRCVSGGVTCVPLCSNDVRLPTPDCPHPQRVQLPGKCCQEWVCENIDNSVLQDAQAAHRPDQLPPLPGYQANPSLNCIEQSTEWSACSRTCGPGISTRVTNQNPACRLEMQIRLCKVRPCHAFPPRSGPVRPRTCQSSYRSAVPVRLFHQGCYSTRVYRPRYCGLCTDGRCCTPYRTRTINVPFRCRGGRLIYPAVMMITSCACHYNCPYSPAATYRSPAFSG